MNEVDTKLFQDFSYRMGQKIKNEEFFYKTNDFLATGREIFKAYYQEAEMSQPEWFPEKLFQDYEERGKFIWSQLYLSHRDAFDVRVDNSILINLEALGARTNRERVNKINFLPVECIIEDSPVLVVHKQMFFQFIDREEGKKDSFFKKTVRAWKGG